MPALPHDFAGRVEEAARVRGYSENAGLPRQRDRPNRKTFRAGMVCAGQFHVAFQCQVHGTSRAVQQSQDHGQIGCFRRFARNCDMLCATPKQAPFEDLRYPCFHVARVAVDEDGDAFGRNESLCEGLADDPAQEDRDGCEREERLTPP
jgi:hypothetical protein